MWWSEQASQRWKLNLSDSPQPKTKTPYTGFSCPKSCGVWNAFIFSSEPPTSCSTPRGLMKLNRHPLQDWIPKAISLWTDLSSGTQSDCGGWTSHFLCPFRRKSHHLVTWGSLTFNLKEPNTLRIPAPHVLAAAHTHSIHYLKTLKCLVLCIHSKKTWVSTVCSVWAPH